MELAKVAAKNGDLETAYECYALISSKSKNTPRYAEARQAMLGVMTEQEVCARARRHERALVHVCACVRVCVCVHRWLVGWEGG